MSYGDDYAGERAVEWSEWEWDSREFWFSSRTKLDGQLEYKYERSTPPEQVMPNRIRRETKSKNDSEDLDSRYHVVPIHDSETFWKPGRVFGILWKPAPGSRSGVESYLSTEWIGGENCTEIRRFVVVQEARSHCLCWAIYTHGGQAKPDLDNHAIIYTEDLSPSFEGTCDIVAGFEQVGKEPIKVRNEESGWERSLRPDSRISYSKLHKVDKNVCVLNIGMVTEQCVPYIITNSPQKLAYHSASEATRPTKYGKKSSRTTVEKISRRQNEDDDLHPWPKNGYGYNQRDDESGRTLRVFDTIDN